MVVAVIVVAIAIVPSWFCAIQIVKSTHHHDMIAGDCQFFGHHVCTVKTLVHFAVESNPVRPIYLKALLHHPDVDVNEPFTFGGEDDIDILKYSTMVLVEGAGRYSCSRRIFAKMRLILEAGVDTAIHSAHLAMVLIERIKGGDLPEIFGSREDLPIKVNVLNAAGRCFSE